MISLILLIVWTLAKFMLIAALCFAFCITAGFLICAPFELLSAFIEERREQRLLKDTK